MHPVTLTRPGIKIELSHSPNLILHCHALADTTYEVSANNEASRGSLTNAVLTGQAYTTGTGGVVLDWTDNTGEGNALGTDLVVGVIISKDGDVVAVIDDDTTTRADASLTGTILSGLTATDLIAFLFFKRGTGESLIISNSDGAEMTA